MNIINKLTLRQLKLNKRRTLVTLIGVIISVAMITAVNVSISSGLDFIRRVTISSEGNWHMGFYNMSLSQLPKIVEAPNVKETLVTYDVGFSKLPVQNNSHKPYLYIEAYNEESFKEMPVKLIEGRLPETDRELVIPASFNKQTDLNYKVGDKVTLEVGDRYTEEDDDSSKRDNTYAPVYDNGNELKEILKDIQSQTYTITGIIEQSPKEYSWGAGYMALTKANLATLSEEATINAYVLYDNVYADIYAKSRALGNEVGVETVDVNSMLLVSYGVNGDSGLMYALIGVISIVLLIIMVGSISLIYNAFAISVVERIQYLGMFASVGATRKQKRNSVLFEGVVIGGISIPIGLLSGILGISVAFSVINRLIEGALRIEEKIRLCVSPVAIIATIILAVLTIFISTYIPAKKASKVSAIEAIKQTQHIKMTAKKVKTSPLTRKIFGIEAEIALKNLKRNGNRYRVTLVSLIISIILFLSTATFSSYMTKTAEMVGINSNYDIEISTPYSNQTLAISDFEKITKLNGIAASNMITYDYAISYLSPEKAVKETEDKLYQTERGYLYNINISGMEDTAFKAYAISQGIDPNKLENSNLPSGLILNVNKFKDKEDKVYKEIPATLLKEGDTIKLEGGEWYPEQDYYKETVFGNVTIGGLVTEPPLGVAIPENPGDMRLIMSYSALERFWSLYSGNLDKVDTSHRVYLYLKADDISLLQDELSTFQEATSTRYYVSNIAEEQKSMRQMQMIMEVFIYGFIVLITAICIANIFNTISTSIALRQREFAMLRSMGMTPKGFNKMINFESAFYGIKSLAYGLPISLGIMLLLYKQLSGSFEFDFFVPIKAIVMVVVAVFVVVGIAMFYSGAKVKGQNIIDGLKDSNL